MLSVRGLLYSAMGSVHLVSFGEGGRERRGGNIYRTPFSGTPRGPPATTRCQHWIDKGRGTGFPGSTLPGGASGQHR